MSDRGMKKYMPFASLVEQQVYLKKMIYEKGKKPKPQISTEQAEKIDRLLKQKVDQVMVFKFYLDGYIYTYKGVIQFLDVKNKQIIIDDYLIPLKNIIDIENPDIFEDIC